MPPILSAEADATARKLMDGYTDGPSPEIPGLVYCAVNKAGEIIFSHGSGRIGLHESSPMTTDTVFWMASCTKLITSIACMQLVEKGILLLDDSVQIEVLAPELKEVKVLERDEDGNFYLEDKKQNITLRMLMNHTAGFGYAFEDLKLRDWSRPIGMDDFSGNPNDILHRPLVNQPGTKFQYGVSMDWVGVIIERVTHSSLEDYFHKHILGPLDIHHIKFFPCKDMKASLAFMHTRASDGTLSVRDHLYRYPLLPHNPDEVRFCMGGGGCFGKPLEYCRILATVLNDGLSPNTGARLLKPETVREMFTDQIPNLPRYCNRSIPVGKPELANPTPLIPCDNDLTEGWGLSFSLSHTESATGRAPGSGSWEGCVNLFWFADPNNGLAGIVASQILPYGDLKLIECSERIEKLLYDEASSG